ncbi:MAG: DUF3857 domain-containing transglutaminase family protein [Bacteroidota bacterium]
MKTLLFLSAFICPPWLTYGQYTISSINDSLTNGANAVFRNRDYQIEIMDEAKFRFTVKEIVSILNNNGKKYAYEYIGYDKLTTVNRIEANSYDASGKLIRRFKKSDIIDQSNVSSGSLYEDDRVKIIDMTETLYPYTIEIEYELDYDFLYYIPGIRVIPDYGVAVEHSSYSITYPVNMKPRFLVKNTSISPEIVALEKNREKRSWNFPALPALKREPFSTGISEMSPVIRSAPSSFEFEGYAGDMTNWKGFGAWIKSLNEGRDKLSESTIKEVQALTAGMADKEKVAAVYNYLQENTRYISIQLGIGGYQPFEAGVVDDVGYGDCKALSNYTVSLLKAVGIKSNYTLIRAGKGNNIDIDFPSNQFNHVIVAVPMETDTVWLECTSQTNPFGYLGSFTGDRSALMITANGGVMVTTPTLNSYENSQIRKATVDLNKEGVASVQVTTTYSGLQYENDNLHFHLDRGRNKMENWIHENTEISSYKLNNFSYENKKGEIPSAKVYLDLAIENLGSRSGERYFMTPNLMNRFTYLPPRSENRTLPVHLSSSFYDLDSIVYSIPHDWFLESIPKDVSLKSEFGTYSMKITVEEGRIIYIRELKLEKGDYPPDSYNDLRNFYKSIVRSDKKKLVLMNRT